MDLSRLASFILELGVLKNMQRTGWLYLGIKEGDNVAAHSFRVSVIAYFLAKELGEDPFKAVTLALFHDILETRTGDINRVSARYLREDVDRVVEEEIIDEDMKKLIKELMEGKTKLARIVKDADRLELVAQAKEYMLQGVKNAEEWIVNGKRELNFDISRKLAEEILNHDGKWWRGLKVKK